MRTMKIKTDEDEIIVHHNCDWSGDVYILWEDSGRKRESKIPSTVLLAISKETAARLVSERIASGFKKIRKSISSHMPGACLYCGDPNCYEQRTTYDK